VLPAAAYKAFYEFFRSSSAQEAREIIDAIDPDPIERIASILAELREASGRCFFWEWAVRRQ
jgi:hypothetical protein